MLRANQLWGGDGPYWIGALARPASCPSDARGVFFFLIFCASDFWMEQMMHHFYGMNQWFQWLWSKSNLESCEISMINIDQPSSTLKYVADLKVSSVSSRRIWRMPTGSLWSGGWTSRSARSFSMWWRCVSQCPGCFTRALDAKGIGQLGETWWEKTERKEPPGSTTSLPISRMLSVPWWTLSRLGRFYIVEGEPCTKMQANCQTMPSY